MVQIPIHVWIWTAITTEMIAPPIEFALADRRGCRGQGRQLSRRGAAIGTSWPADGRWRRRSWPPDDRRTRQQHCPVAWNDSQSTGGLLSFRRTAQIFQECDGVFRDFRRTFIRSGSTLPNQTAWSM